MFQRHSASPRRHSHILRCDYGQPGRHACFSSSSLRRQLRLLAFRPSRKVLARESQQPCLVVASDAQVEHGTWPGKASWCTTHSVRGRRGTCSSERTVWLLGICQWPPLRMAGSLSLYARRRPSHQRHFKRSQAPARTQAFQEGAGAGITAALPGRRQRRSGGAGHVTRRTRSGARCTRLAPCGAAPCGRRSPSSYYCRRSSSELMPLQAR